MELNCLRVGYRRVRQTHLGTSAQKALVLIDLRGSTSPGKESVQDAKNIRGPRREAFIYKLPDEILVLTVKLAARRELFGVFECRYDPPYYYTALATLALVSRRFSRISIPLLYRHIHLGYPDKIVPPSLASKLLHRSLRNDPTLRPYCLTLVLHIDDIRGRDKPGDFTVATTLAGWLTKTRCVRMHGGFDSKHNAQAWALIRDFGRHMREIEHLAVSREAWGLYLGPFFDHLDMPSLRRLSICGLSETKPHAPMLQPKQLRTASFTALSLIDYEETSQATAQLLLWPKELIEFEFASVYNNRHYFDLPMFYDMLSIHRNTLRILDIGYLSYAGRGGSFRACDFPNLESLCLSRWQMSQALDRPTLDASLLLGPRLRSFGWDFTIMDQHSETWTDFGPSEATWLRGLTEAALAMQASLSNVRVKFTPDVSSGFEEDGYPWDRMDVIREEMRPRGIALEYNAPHITKTAWLEDLHRPSPGVPSEDGPGSDTLGTVCSSTSTEGEHPPPESNASEGGDIRGFFPVVTVAREGPIGTVTPLLRP